MDVRKRLAAQEELEEGLRKSDGGEDADDAGGQQAEAETTATAGVADEEVKEGLYGTSRPTSPILRSHNQTQQPAVGDEAGDAPLPTPLPAPRCDEDDETSPNSDPDSPLLKHSRPSPQTYTAPWMRSDDGNEPDEQQQETYFAPMLQHAPSNIREAMHGWERSVEGEARDRALEGGMRVVNLDSSEDISTVTQAPLEWYDDPSFLASLRAKSPEASPPEQDPARFLEAQQRVQARSTGQADSWLMGQGSLFERQYQRYQMEQEAQDMANATTAVAAARQSVGDERRARVAEWWRSMYGT